MIVVLALRSSEGLLVTHKVEVYRVAVPAWTRRV